MTIFNFTEQTIEMNHEEDFDGLETRNGIHYATHCAADPHTTLTPLGDLNLKLSYTWYDLDQPEGLIMKKELKLSSTNPFNGLVKSLSPSVTDLPFHHLALEGHYCVVTQKTAKILIAARYPCMDKLLTLDYPVLDRRNSRVLGYYYFSLCYLV